MIVVSDTSPLTALLTVGQSNLLPLLFAEVFIPRAVQKELLRQHPQLPDWLNIGDVQDRGPIDRYMQTVDAGEAEAIGLARELRAERLLIDERRGRQLAQAEGVAVIGLLGIVLLAKRNGLIPSARELLARLDVEAGIYLASEIREAALKTVGE